MAFGMFHDQSVELLEEGYALGQTGVEIVLRGWIIRVLRQLAEALENTACIGIHHEDRFVQSI